MATITRGTTPTVTATVRGANLEGMGVYITIGRKGDQPWATVGPEDVAAHYDGADTILTAELSQEQTLACPAGAGFVQVRAIKDGHAVASAMAPVEIAPVIHNGVLNG